MFIDKFFEGVKKIFNPPVRFDDESYVDWLNREAIVYVENGRQVPINFLFNPESKVGSARTLRHADISYWDEDGKQTPVTDEERARIMEKVRVYCSKKNIELQLL